MSRFGRRTPREPSGAFRLGAGLAGAGLFLAGLLTGFWAAFPTDALLQRALHDVERQGQLRVETGPASLSPLFTLHGNRTVLRSATSAWPPVQIDAFDLAPLWRSLFTANPGARWNARLLGGAVQGTFFRDGVLEATAVDLALDLPLQEGIDLRLSGRLAEGRFEGAAPLRPTTASTLSLVFDEAVVTGLQRDLSLGRIRLQASGRGPVMQVDSLEATGGDFEVTGSGDLLLGRDAASSRLRLRVVIRPTSDADPALVSLLEVATRKQPDGSFALRLDGPLANPALR